LKKPSNKAIKCGEDVEAEYTALETSHAELANQASGVRIRNIFVFPPPVTQTSPSLQFASSSSPSPASSPGTTLEPYTLRVQLFKAGLDGWEFSSGAL
jgi:hypothetical protein